MEMYIVTLNSFFFLYFIQYYIYALYVHLYMYRRSCKEPTKTKTMNKQNNNKKHTSSNLVVFLVLRSPFLCPSRSKGRWLLFDGV